MNLFIKQIHCFKNERRAANASLGCHYLAAMPTASESNHFREPQIIHMSRYFPIAPLFAECISRELNNGNDPLEAPLHALDAVDSPNF